MNKRLLHNIIALSIPAIITNITTPLLGLTDIAVVGHMGSAVYIAAIAIGGMIFNVLYWLFGFLRMGSSGLTAQACGASDIQECAAILVRALLLAIVIGLLFIVLQRPIVHCVMAFMDAGAETRLLAVSYFDICIWGAPAVLGTYALTGWFLGMQNTRIPMWVSIFIDLLNIAVSLILVFVFKLKIDGVAFGTLVAQWFGFILALALCVARYRLVFPKWAIIMSHDKICRFFSVNSDIFLRTVCIVVVTLCFTRAGAAQGALMLAVNALLMQLFTLFSFFMDGIAFAAEAMCGMYKGGAMWTRLQATVRILISVGAVVATVFTLTYFCCGEFLLRMLSTDLSVVQLAMDYFGWAVFIPVVGFAAFIWDGIFIGITGTRSMLMSMLLATVAFFGIYFASWNVWGNHGLWFAFLCYLFIRGVVLSIIGLRHKRGELSSYSSK